MRNRSRVILFFLLFSFFFVGIGGVSAAADSPDNLAIMRARLKAGKDKTVSVFSVPAAGKKLCTVNSGDTVFVVGKTDAGSDTWYEIRTAPDTKSADWPGSGWIPATSVDAFDTPSGDRGALYAPEYFYPPENRLAYRLTLDYGHYPKLCFKILGKPLKHDQAYAKSVTDFLKYRHLLVMLVRTTKRVQSGELAAVTVDPRRGNDVSFGPLKIGEDATRLKEIFPEYSGMDGVWLFGDEHRFRFTVSNGLIQSMQYGSLLASSGFGNSDIFYQLPIEAKAGYPEFFGFLQQTTYWSDGLEKTPWTEATYAGSNQLRLTGGQDAPELTLLMLADGSKWDAHITHCAGNTAICREVEDFLPIGGRIMIIAPHQPDGSEQSAFRAELDPYFKERLNNRVDLSGFMQKIRNLDGVYSNSRVRVR